MIVVSPTGLHRCHVCGQAATTFEHPTARWYCFRHAVKETEDVLPDGKLRCDFCNEQAISAYGKGGRPHVLFCENHYLKTFSKYPPESPKWERPILDFSGGPAESQRIAWTWGAACGFFVGLLVWAAWYVVKPLLWHP